MSRNKKQIHHTKTGKKMSCIKNTIFSGEKKHVKLQWSLPHFWEVFSSYSTLPETNIAPENRPSQRKFLFQPSIFGCFGRGTIIKVGVNSALTSNMRNCTSLALEKGNLGFRVPPAVALDPIWFIIVPISLGMKFKQPVPHFVHYRLVYWVIRWDSHIYL